MGQSSQSIVVVSGYSEEIWYGQRTLPDQPDELQSVQDALAPKNGISEEKLALQSGQTSGVDTVWAGSEWMQALEDEGVLELRPLTLSNFVTADYKKVLQRTSALSQKRLLSTQKDLILASRRSHDLRAGQKALQLAGEEISGELDSMAQRMGCSALSPEELRKQSHFLNRIQLKAEIVVL
jgi:hypothetical protein